MSPSGRTQVSSTRTLDPALGLVALLIVGLAGAEIALFTAAGVVPLWLFVGLAAVAVGYAGAGILAWRRRPANLTGALLCLCGIALLTAAAGNTGVPALAAAGYLAAKLPIAVLLHLLLAFPSGRLPDRASRVLAVAGYVVTVGFQVPQLLAGGDPGLPAAVVVAHRPDVADAAQGAAGAVVLVATAAVLVRRLRVANRQQRRTLAAVCGYGTFAILFLAGSSYLAPALGAVGLLTTRLAVVAGVPFAFVTGVLRGGGFARTGELGELAMWLGTVGAGRPHLRDALGRALGDPSLELLFWLPELHAHVDAAGRPVALPRPGSGRAAVEVVLGGETVGAITYDATLLADAESVRAAGHVVALAIERERLTVQLIAGREALRKSRARIVSSTDRERRRVARDLHDGLQARLVVLALRAGRIATDRNTPPAVRTDLARLGDDLEGAIAELRGLVHGIMPALLLERGLVAAIEDLILRSPLRAHLELPEVGLTLPRTVEHTGYFVVAEALTNVVKHARAASVRVRVARRDGVLHLEIGDDGVGGARPDGGSGLRGIADRVDVLGGRFAVDSRRGEGTRLVVELPCGS